jgi:hypothetical protein
MKTTLVLFLVASLAGAAHADDYHDEMAGWLVHTPDHWKYREQGGTVMFGSDTEAGAILVAFTPGLTYPQMEAGVGAYIQSLGATQVGHASPFATKAGKALVVEMTGTLPDGTNLHARAIGVAGPAGVVSVTGITTPQLIGGLRRRVDQLAQSVQFFTPKRTPAMTGLVGAWWHYHSVGSGLNGSSYERTIELCANGTFFDSSASDISARAENKNTSSPYYGSSTSAFSNSQNAGAGRWTATGDRARGQIRLVFNNGQVEQHAYAFVKQGDIELDGRWYGRSPDKGGRCR